MDATNGLKETTRVTAPVASTTLSVNIFTAPGKAMVGERPRPFGEPLGFDPITSTLIFGEHDAVLVDAMGTVAEAEALADWIALHNRNLQTIYITHGHFDHFYGLSVLLDRFPGARAIATPKTVEAMQSSFVPPLSQFARQLFPGQVPTKLVSPEPYERDTFTLEGHELRIIEQGRTDCPDSTSLHVPSIGLIVAGDVVYNQCRMYVGDTTPESRQNWIAALDRLAALNPVIVVAGHKKPGALDSPSAIQDSKRYLQDFDRVQKNRDVRPGAVRSDDGAVPALGSQSVVVDVRIPRGITHINRGGASLRTLEEAADDELAHIQENRIRFQRGEQNDNKRKSLSASLERSWLALERWQGLYRRRLLSQRAYGSGPRPDERGLRNHFR